MTKDRTPAGKNNNQKVAALWIIQAFYFNKRFYLVENEVLRNRRNR